jgi:hypothetical protein
MPIETRKVAAPQQPSQSPQSWELDAVGIMQQHPHSPPVAGLLTTLINQAVSGEDLLEIQLNS